MTKKKILMYVASALVWYVFCLAYVVAPDCKVFGFGVLFALLSLGAGYIQTCIYLAVQVLASLSVQSIYVSLITCALCVPLVAIAKKRKIKTFVYYIFAFLSQCINIIINIRVPKIALTWFFSICLGLMFMCVCRVVFSAIIKRKNNFVCNTDEIIAIGLMLMVFACGLANIKFGVMPLRIVALLCVLICTYHFNSKWAYVCAILFGLGYAINSKDLSMVAVLTCYAVSCVAFKSNIKIFSIVAMLVCDVALSFYINGFNFSIFSLIDIAISSIIFLLIPKKVFDGIKTSFGTNRQDVASKNIVNKTREELFRRLSSVSTVFADMDNTYRKMIKGSMSPTQAKDMIAKEMVNHVCVSCPERNKCMRVDGKFTLEVFDELLNAGFERGKVTLLDVPAYLTGRCNNVNVMLATLNNLLKNYKQYDNMIKSSDSSKLLIADNLGGVSKMLQDLADEVNINITFDTRLENKIMEELTYKNIVVNEVVVYMLDNHTRQITLTMPATNVDKDLLGRVVSSACGSQMYVSGSEVSGDIQIITLKQKPNCDMVFGVSSVGKNGMLANGDSHSVIKVEDGKYILTLGDGMGTGSKAHNTSALTVKLIENFYKAGFDSDIILSSVNKLLGLNNDENYSTLDICVMDLYKNTYDFIKLGAPFGVIRNNGNLQVVEGSGLPIGVLDEMQPHVIKKLVNPFDDVIMFSDGVLDAYGGKESLLNYLTCLNTQNPQTLADEILDGAIDMCNGVSPDDMTVLVCRVYAL